MNYTGRQSGLISSQTPILVVGNMWLHHFEGLLLLTSTELALNGNFASRWLGYMWILGYYYARYIMPLNFKGALSGLRQYLATESHLKMMKNLFYFTLKAISALKIFKVLS